MKLFYLKVQSTVDVITNSSTEIFCCKEEVMKKEGLEKYLQYLIDKFNEENPESHYPVEREHFGEIKVCTEENYKEHPIYEFYDIAEPNIENIVMSRLQYHNFVCNRCNELGIIDCYSDYIEITGKPKSKKTYKEYKDYSNNENAKLYNYAKEIYDRVNNTENYDFFNSEELKIFYDEWDLKSFMREFKSGINLYNKIKKDELIGTIYVTEEFDNSVNYEFYDFFEKETGGFTDHLG